MTVDTILLALRKISSAQQRDVAIFPTPAVTRGREGVTISHPVSGYQLRLRGKVDHVIIDYENDNKRE